jgi:tetratricopeptide (TPR) repeat protein
MPEVTQRTFWETALLVASITFLLYLPALQNDFVNWDDGEYVYESRGIRSIDFGFLKWIFTAVVSSNWHPLTLFSHAVDYALWGLEPLGHHLTSVIFHAFNTFLVFILAVRLSGYGEPGKMEISNGSAGAGRKALVVAFVTALLFGIHPLHVESVAWVSERKDVLSAFFFLLSVLSYLRYTSSRGSRRSIFYGACLVLFIMALMSKPMAVTLPAVLLILDYYPLRRLNVDGGFKSARVYPLMERVLVALRAFAFYIYKMVLPVNLVPFYPYPKTIEFNTVEYKLSIILFIAATAFCLWSSKRERLFLAVWFYYVITLIPVVGIVQVGGQAAADRYTYLPSLGPFVLAGLAAGAAFERSSKKHLQALTVVFVLIISGILANKTVKQIAIWKDTITLWSYEIKLFPEKVPIAHNHLGNAYNKEGLTNEAKEELKLAIRLKPDLAEAHSNLGIVYYYKGLIDEAEEEYKIAIRYKPDLAGVHNNLGLIYEKKGDYERAMEEYKTEVTLNSGFVETHYNLGNLYYKMGRIDEAIMEYREALRFKLYPADVRYKLGLAYKEKGLKDEAIREFQKVLEIRPDHTEAREILKSLSR